MPSPLFILVVHSLRLGLFRSGDIVSEFLLGSLGHPDLETDPYEERRSGSYTVEPSCTDQASGYLSAQLGKRPKELTQDHQELHENSTSDQSIHVNIPHPTSTLGPRDVDVEKLIFVDDG
jgi:hypothetical protein